MWSRQFLASISPMLTKVIDIDVLGEPIFVSEFVIDYVRCYDVDEIPFVK